MKINRLKVKNYRNFKEINISLGDIVVLIGENNGGKSNLLKAITIPFLTDDYSSSSKNLSWIDINDESKEKYYKYLIDNQEKIKNGEITCSEFIKEMPIVEVEVHLTPREEELYFVKDLSYKIENDEIVYGLRYEYKPFKHEELFETIKNILLVETIDEDSIKKIKMNLLPVEYYNYYITVPNKGPISYDALKCFKYTALEAERDDFSRTRERLGSKSLVNVLQRGLDKSEKVTVEKEYNNFFDKLKSIIKMEEVINWQDETEIEDAKEFFSHISILPNMPPMKTILNSIRLGYSDEELSMQGLGHRNMILLLVLINSLIERRNDIALNILTIEEPEAHLCINNIKIMASFFQVFAIKNPSMQLFYSTHSTEFINKMNLKNVVIVHDGDAVSIGEELNDEELDYLIKNPNTDLFKLFFSKKCILFEGISEEMLLRSYLDSIEELSDVELISFHKGYTKIIEIWEKVNAKTKNKLGIIRDYDEEDKAKKKHDKYNNEKTICVRTTSKETLEPEIVYTGNNYEILKEKYGDTLGWKDLSKDQLQRAWRDAKASDMLIICKDIEKGELKNLQMPKHIKEVLDFMRKDINAEEVSNEN